MPKSNWKLGIIGGGVMGKALARALLDKGVVDESRAWVAVRSEDKRESLASELGIDVHTDYAKALAKTDVVLVCVKPAQMRAVLADLKRAKLPKKGLLISIAAGGKIANRASQYREAGEPARGKAARRPRDAEYSLPRRRGRDGRLRRQRRP